MTKEKIKIALELETQLEEFKTDFENL